ncbi:predicted protein [Botrytis cinerea T4]|uniref:Uncharacterized protein n=1 Tax=Botryotinia fuckeliana (strain T4) TaxID=999810 RepID=G2Y7K4_BOTF4|nr:predicted protein [Botrytis cinerea T4]
MTSAVRYEHSIMGQGKELGLFGLNAGIWTMGRIMDRS